MRLRYGVTNELRMSRRCCFRIDSEPACSCSMRRLKPTTWTASMTANRHWALSSAIDGTCFQRTLSSKLYERSNRESIGSDFGFGSRAAVPATSELGRVLDHKQTIRGHASMRAVDPNRTSCRSRTLVTGSKPRLRAVFSCAWRGGERVGVGYCGQASPACAHKIGNETACARPPPLLRR